MSTDGGFAVGAQVGAQLVTALDAVAATLAAEAGRWAVIGGEPPLGATPAGRFVAARMAATATDDRGLLTGLERARTMFPQYVEAIETAAKNYAGREAATLSVFSRPES
ncbi:hypothetical protein [Amycolatopsis sp. MtRt-6]|uniref:hypothetical protein n=1 Tax=Amycolatopsis sp. MtRt-6 TaxID=2792782 RepID=UPI001A905C53|nr:hypothetical protein [Amycolatopsis sp. MtRt-6]